MKKGLRPRRQTCCRPQARQNRRPDEEGIKTIHHLLLQLPQCQNRRPDEEGIKTWICSILCDKKVRTVDLMKKGLRLARVKTTFRIASQNRRPDEEGIKTYYGSKFPGKSVRTVDLMKKGLRRRKFRLPPSKLESEP